MLSALACGGHVLLEDVPGTAKTILARSIAGTIEGAIPARIQCTPDLQPTDVTGLSVYNQQTREFEFRPGPIFANVVLVDEINRAMPKTQSALLEAMAERQVTVDGVTRPLPDPFLLIATENPIEQEGTFPLPGGAARPLLPETALGYPARRRGAADRREQRARAPARRPAPGRSTSASCASCARRSRTSTSTSCSSAGSSTSSARRATSKAFEVGASVRGSLALERTRAPGRSCTGATTSTAEDVERLFLPVLGHRLLLHAVVPRRDARAALRRGAASASGTAASRSRRRPSPTGTATRRGAASRCP